VSGFDLPSKKEEDTWLTFNSTKTCFLIDALAVKVANTLFTACSDM
jgi:hypothetical protein